MQLNYPNWPELLVLVLATYYAAVTLAKLHGPFGLAERMRHAVYRRRGFNPLMGPEGEIEWLRLTHRDDYPTDPRRETIDDDWLAGGVSCPLCLSLYCGAVLALVWFAGGAVGQAVVGVLAVAGGASLAFSVGRHW